jgi:hypothetical protein
MRLRAGIVSCSIDLEMLSHRFHEKLPSTCAFSLSEAEWELLEERLKAAPMMVVPLEVSRAEGATQQGAFVTFVSQAQLPQHILFTPLHQFQQQAGHVAPQGLATVYRELSPDKGIVLGRMDVSGLLSKGSAALLVERVASMYLRDERFVHTQTFNRNPGAFQFGKVLDLFGFDARSSGAASAPNSQ